MSDLNRLVFILPIAAILYSCAAVTGPEGGPKDEKKPELVKTTPANGTLNFNGKIITLSFNEDVRTQDLGKQLIITPNSGNTYSIKSDRKEMFLEFDNALEENTTYLLDFRNGIEDITEGNKAENVKIAFSTGNALDSGKIEGIVTNYLTEAPENNITVALYPEEDTSNIRTKAPYYFTKTSPEGTYSLQNIRSGKYWLFAHNDKNENQFYDQQSEKIAYLPQLITISEKPLKQDLKTVLVDTKKPFIVSTQNFTDKNTLVYNEGIRQVSFKTLESPSKNLKLISVQQENGRNIDVYPDKGQLPDKVIAISIDSSYNTGIDTVKFNLLGKSSIPATQTYKLKNETIQKGDKIEIEFPNPIQVIKNQPITLIEDSVGRSKPNYPGELSLNETKTVLTLNKAITAKKTIELQFDSTAILGVNGQPFKKTTLKVPVQEKTGKTGAGSLTGTIKTANKNYSVELSDQQGKLIKTLQNSRTFKFENLKPGNYNILVKIDENNNGKWEIGDKNLKAAPERLYRYPKPLNVRANWDIEDIIIQF